jgi:methyl-accepting chemotaxis protein
MRERLALAFFLLAVLVLLVASTLRALTLGDALADQEMRHLHHEALLTAAAINAHVEAGMGVDDGFLAGLVEPGSRVEYAAEDGDTAVVTGPEFRDGDVITYEAEAAGGTVTLSADAQDSSGLLARQLWALATLVLLVSLLAGLAGWWAARWLVAPFRSLADAAAALGRGRFDLRLPETRVPEAVAIGQALKASAAQLEARLSRESEFAGQASHELRTPLTSLRMELEDLTLRSDVPDDVKQAAARCIERVDAVNAAVDGLVSLSRRGVLVEGGQVRLGELATQITQQWSDRLAASRRTVSASAEGELDEFFTPGPVEQVLEVVLGAVERGDGPVRLVFEGSESHVRVVVPAGAAGSGPVRGLEAASGLATPQGGRVTGDLVASDLEILMPRR